MDSGFDLLSGRDASEWMQNKGIASPDISKMIPLQVDKSTTFYFETQKRKEDFIKNQNLMNNAH